MVFLDLSIPAMEDELGIVYLIENAQQFWSELEDILLLPNDNSTTLLRLDSALRRFLTICGTYHEQYLQSPLQLEHACELLLNSELFKFHSERMCEILSDEAQSNTNPHFQFIVYNVLLYHGRRHASFFRSQKRWQPLLPLLMDHILVEIDPEVEDTYIGNSSLAGSTGGSSISIPAVPIPIEVKLRSLAVRLVYEVCRVQKLSVQDLKIFDDQFLDFLFDLVEQTRNTQDETFNYSVIKLIVSLNEQFMVASLGAPPPSAAPKPAEDKNRVLHVLVRRLNSTKTFGENMIFMLNRANRTPEDLCMQLLILKLLYLLFTTKGTSEYFYTNDLCVLVDVFLRELIDLDEESESLRHTYLRVLHPLLTKTQLREVPYKRPQVVSALESLINNAAIRDISPTTRRLVERCLSGGWCVQLRKSPDRASPNSDGVALGHIVSPTKTLKPSRSFEVLPRPAPGRTLEALRRPSNESASSLPGVASASAVPKRRHHRPTLTGPDSSGSITHVHKHPHPHTENQADHPRGPPIRADSYDSAFTAETLPSPSHPHAPPAFPAMHSLPNSPAPGQKPPGHRRSAPPAPPKRRKPPAVPVSGATIKTIASSAAQKQAQAQQVV